ncbi:MAG: colicin transporter [Bifidobacterium sp.]|uniref:colicin transporter n=1 Tax=Bifidobacterium sp. TaxID=41200 RepID=UPI00257B03C8|nr:colicin transporter [Bifidobacterium sp.]MBS5400333.1 colicin transporter [Bifidobacterium sp.]
MVALVLAGLGVWQVLRVRGAVASCESMAAQATAAYEDLLKLAESGELKDAEAITADQVEDPDTVTGLAAAVDKAGETVSIGVCGVDWYDLYSNRITEKPTRGKEQFESKRQALRKAMDAVVASRDAKTLAAATSALKSKTDQAATLLKESDGKVQDDTTRQTLGKAIDQARELLDANDDAKAMNDATTSLDQATAAVNDSVKAKSDADAKAAAEAAAAQAAQQAQQSYTPSYTGGYTGGYSGGYTPSYSGGSSSGGSTSSGGSIFDRLPSAIGGTGDAPCTYPECCVPVCIDGECQPCS